MALERGATDGLSPTEAADRIAESVAASEVKGGLALRLLRGTLRWALARGAVGAREAARDEAWSSRANDGRLRAETLRSLAWTLVLADDGTTDPVGRAAKVLVAALAVRADLAVGSAGELMFGTTLVPKAERFEVHRGAGRHVVVGVNEALWAVDVLDADGAVLDEATLAASLRACVSASKKASPPVLALTAATRTQAAGVWPAIAARNAASARLLEEAICSVFLDPLSPEDVDATGRLAQGGPLPSRCFWHALEVVVFANGKAALVGSFVAGVAADGALDIGARLDAARTAGTKPGAKPSKAAPPVRLSWDLTQAEAKLLAAIGRGGAVDAGGFLVVPGFGRASWGRGETKTDVEGAIVLALRLALDAVMPELDELETMVGLAHIHRGLVTRLGSATPAMRALVLAARDQADLHAPVALALAVHRARIRDAKRAHSAEVAFELAARLFARVGPFARAVVTAAARLVVTLVAMRTPVSERPTLHLPLVAVDSSVPRPPGITAVGRFGVLAPARAIWIHHSLGDADLSFVLQLGPEVADRASRLREAIPLALARVRGALGGPTPAAIATAPAPSSRVAFRRLAGLLGALRAAARAS